MITLCFDLPTSVNQMYKPGYYNIKLSQEAKIWKEYAKIIANHQYKDKPLEGALSVTYRFYNSRMDFDNPLKVANDALNGICWIDDSQIIEAHIYVNREDSNPRMEMEIIQL